MNVGASERVQIHPYLFVCLGEDTHTLHTPTHTQTPTPPGAPSPYTHSVSEREGTSCYQQLLIASHNTAARWRGSCRPCQEMRARASSRSLPFHLSSFISLISFRSKRISLLKAVKPFVVFIGKMYKRYWLRVGAITVGLDGVE